MRKTLVLGLILASLIQIVAERSLTELNTLRTYQPFSRQANFENNSGKLGGFGR